MSLIIRQNCHPEVSYPMHIIHAIAFKLKAARRAKVMITHMGFHAILPRPCGQGRAAQLVNPLTANSRFADRVMAAGPAKSLVAGCDDGTTRRSRRRGLAGCPPAGPRRPALMDRFSPPGRCCTEVGQVVHGHWLAWTGLCAPEPAAPGRGPATPAVRAPGRTPLVSGPTAVLRGTGSAPATAAGPGPAPARTGLAAKAYVVWPFSIKSGPGSAYRPIDIEFDKARPLIKARSVSRWCTCPAQFIHHGVVGVIQ
jgi:hypothetical protein